MFKKIGVLALLVAGGAAFLHPSTAAAQEYRGWNGYEPGYRAERYYDRDQDRFRDHRREQEWRRQEWREERRERAWRERQWREQQRWESQRYAPYGSRPYYGYPY